MKASNAATEIKSKEVAVEAPKDISEVLLELDN